MLALFGIGCVVGTIGGALGVGGGLLLVPILYGVFDWPLISAVATSQFCIVATSLAATVRYSSRSQVILPLGIRLESATIVGSLLGAWWAPRLPTVVVASLFVAIALFAAYRLVRTRADVPTATPGQENSETHTNPGAAALVASGGTGIAAALVGVGGGVFKVPIMALIVGVPIRQAIATSAFMVGITAATAGVLYYLHGALIVGATVPIVLGMLVGSTLGAKYQTHVPATVLRRVFAVVLIALAARMIWNIVR